MQAPSKQGLKNYGVKRFPSLTEQCKQILIWILVAALTDFDNGVHEDGILVDTLAADILAVLES